jgi:hypothetical protein
LWSPDPETGLSKALRFETLTVLAFLAPLFLVRSRRSLAHLMVAIVGFSVFMALTAVSTGDPLRPIEAAGGNEIQLGVYSAFGLIASLGYLVMRGGVWRALWLVPGAFLASTLLVAGSRGALISGSLALLFVWARQLVASPRMRVIVLATAAATATVLALNGANLAGEAASEYEQSLFSTNAAQVVGSRQYLLQRAGELSVAHPEGLGAGGYEAETGVRYPHNIFLELAVEQGMIAVALFLALVVVAWRARRFAPGGTRTPEAIVTGGLIVLFLVEALFSFDINSNRLVFFALGLAVALPDLRVEQAPDGRQPRPAGKPRRAGLPA